jgi:hypothetical protein
MREFIKAKQTEPDGAWISEQRILQDKVAIKANTRCMQWAGVEKEGTLIYNSTIINQINLLKCHC